MNLIFFELFINLMTVSAAEITVTGEGSTLDSAIHTALRNAIEREVGVLIDSQTLIQNQQIINDEIILDSSGFVENYEIIRQGQHDGIIEVELRVTVSTEKLRSSLMTTLQKKSIVERNMDDPRIFVKAIDEYGGKYPEVENEIISTLRNYGFNRFVNDLNRADYIIDVIVKIGQSNSIHTANLSIKMIGVNSNEIIYAGSFSSRSKMFTNNSTSGAIQSAAKRAAPAIANAALNRAAQLEQHITIIINRNTLKNFGGIENIQERIKNIKGINDTFIRYVNESGAEIDVNFDGTAADLSTELKIKGFWIIEMDSAQILI